MTYAPYPSFLDLFCPARLEDMAAFVAADTQCAIIRCTHVEPIFFPTIHALEEGVANNDNAPAYQRA